MVSFKQFVEQELGKFPHFLIYAVLEWTLIIILFIDGLLAFFANEFAKFFQLKIPCLFCTRIDHVFVRRNADFYYNDSFCDPHKKNVSTLAFCHVHKKLSDVKKMCERCLVPFATEKESGCGHHKSLVGILHKDIEMFVDDYQELHPPLTSGKKDDSSHQVEKISEHCCCCCGGPLKVKSSFSRTKSVSFLLSAATPTPRAPYPSFKYDENSNLGLDLSQIKWSELKLVDNDSEHPEDDDRSNTTKEDHKAVKGPLDSEEEEKIPKAIRGNRFFGIPLTDSPSSTPRWATRLARKSMPERTEFASESGGGNVENEGEGDSILHHLNRQVRLDRKSLIALYMELDEERSASAVAANNAMAMITRLQAEKAAVRMEALQYQRMMEEQAEYDQEALQEMKELLVKREEEVKELEAELEAYRAKYGCLGDFEVQADESDKGCRVVNNITYPSNTLSPECGSSATAANTIKEETANGGGKAEEDDQPAPLHDGAREETQKNRKVDRSRFLGRLRNLDKKIEISDDGDRSSRCSSDTD